MESREPSIVKTTLREKWQAYRHFLVLMWRANPRLAIFRFSLLFLGAFLQPLEVYVFSLLIAAIASGRTHDAPTLLIVSVSAYALRTLVGSVTYSKIDDWFIRSTSLFAQEQIYAHLGALDPEVLMREDVRRDLDFVREDIWRLNQLPSQTEFLIRSILKVIGTIALAFVAPWWVTVLVVATAVAEAAMHGYESHRDLWDASWNSLDGRRVEYTRYVFLMGEEFRELRLLGAAKMMLRKMGESAGRIIGRFRDAGIRSAMMRTALGIFNAGAYTVVVLILGWRAFSGPAALATLYVAINLFSMMGDGLGGISNALGRLWADLGVLSRVHALLQVEPETTKGARIPTQQLVVTFDHVSFRYPHATKDALHDVSLTIREGDHVAIVGENGAGKSTFLRLLSGLDRPTSGTILVNGKPLESYRREEWRQTFHLMLQDAKLYQDFLRDNLMYGASGKKEMREGFPLHKSVAIAGADAVIENTPHGYETFLGDWAAPPGITPHRVSGGQQQRLLIARALVHGGRIIGFDEPTSAMDAVAETSFFERLHASMKKRGLIFISHRFSTVRRSARILVFDEGRLMEDGSHEDLLARGGQYAKLYREQAKWYA